MDAVDVETLKKMQQEDSWLASREGIMLLGFFGGLGNDNASLETQIRLAELSTVDHDDSAALHVFLATRYGALETDLGYYLRVKIEEEKLRKADKGYLFDLHTKSTKERLVALPHKGQDFGENMQAATDYLASVNIQEYIACTNSQRELLHLNKSLKLSGKNPVVFETFVKPAADWMKLRAVIHTMQLPDNLRHGCVVDVPYYAQYFQSLYDGALDRHGRENLQP